MILLDIGKIYMVNVKAAMNIAASKHLPYLEACYTLSSSLICGTSTSIYTKKYDICTLSTPEK